MWKIEDISVCESQACVGTQLAIKILYIVNPSRDYFCRKWNNWRGMNWIGHIIWIEGRVYTGCGTQTSFFIWIYPYKKEVSLPHPVLISYSNGGNNGIPIGHWRTMESLHHEMALMKSGHEKIEVSHQECPTVTVRVHAFGDRSQIPRTGVGK
jgi:hypothetical protein